MQGTFGDPHAEPTRKNTRMEVSVHRQNAKVKCIRRRHQGVADRDQANALHPLRVEKDNPGGLSLQSIPQSILKRHSKSEHAQSAGPLCALRVEGTHADGQEHLADTA